MTTLQYIHFSIELWGAFFCFIAVINIALKRSFDVKDSVIYLATWTNSMEKLEGSNEFAK
jgi:hypothetical protein